VPGDWHPARLRFRALLGVTGFEAGRLFVLKPKSGADM
jgi:hypothetical protein